MMNDTFERSFDPSIIDNAADLLAEILENMGLRCDIETTIRDTSVVFNICGTDADFLLFDRNGTVTTELVNALAWIVRRSKDCLNSAYSMILDVNDYRSKRMLSMEGLAESLYIQAKRGKRIDCYGMNPVDRRAIHHHIAKHGDIITQSAGENYCRRLSVNPEHPIEEEI